MPENYTFNVIFNTSGSTTKNEHFFDVPPFYFKATEFVDGIGYSEILDTYMACYASNFYGVSANLRTSVEKDCIIAKASSLDASSQSSCTSDSYAVGSVVKTATVYIYGNTRIRISLRTI